MKSYKVGVFHRTTKTGKEVFNAYVRDYSPDWEGCIEIDVDAENGKAAKKKAIDCVRRTFIYIRSGVKNMKG